MPGVAHRQHVAQPMFHQSGGCCDGSAPMCYPDGDFKLGGQGVHLGDLDVEGLEKRTVDVVKGRGSGFSVEAPEGVRFIIRSRLFSDDEWRDLEGQ